MNDLINETLEYLKNAYIPYSNFAVAACVKTKDKKYFGVNVENVSFGLSNCAERSAMFAAYSDGVRKQDIECLVVVTKQDKLTYPCGACRQVMVELLETTTPIIVSNGVKVDEVTILDLLPKAFSEDDLK